MITRFVPCCKKVRLSKRRMRVLVGEPFECRRDTQVPGRSFSQRLFHLAADRRQIQLLQFLFESGHRIPSWIQQ